MFRRHWLLLIVAIQASLLAYSAKVHSPTWDEVGHLAAGISHWKLGRFELYSVNPPLIRTIAAAPVVLFADPEMDWGYYRSQPALRSEVFLGRRMIEMAGERSDYYFFLARLAVIPITLIGTVLCALWARELFGPKASMLAAVLWAFSPTTLGYGALITPDIGSAVAMLGATLAFWKWMQVSDWRHSLLLLVTCALAILTKSVWIMLPVLFLGIWLVSRIYAAVQKSPSQPATHWSIPGTYLVLAMVGSLCVVNAFYGFADVGRPLGKFQFVSQSLAGPPDCENCGGGHVGNRFAGTWMSYIPVPLPANFVQGVDIQRRDFELGFSDPGWKSYWNGQWRQGGWWYYYFVGLFLKEPLVLWALVALATVFYLRQTNRQHLVVPLACFAAPALALFFVASANTGLNRYVRYVLPIIPVIYVWASQLASSTWMTKPWAQRSLVAAAGLWVCVSMWHAPHWLSYFNSVAGGPSGGHRYLCDSNVDWGQDLNMLKSWLEKHPDAKKDLHLAYFGAFDPVAVGVMYKLPAPLHEDGKSRSTADQLWMGPHPGWYVVSKNYVVGHSMPVPDGMNNMNFQFYGEPVFTYFSEFKPVDRIGHSLLVYHLEASEVDKVRMARGLTPLDINSLPTKPVEQRIAKN